MVAKGGPFPNRWGWFPLSLRSERDLVGVSTCNGQGLEIRLVASNVGNNLRNKRSGVTANEKVPEEDRSEHVLEVLANYVRATACSVSQGGSGVKSNKQLAYEEHNEEELSAV